MTTKDKVIELVVANLGVSESQAAELIQKQFLSNIKSKELAEKIFVEMVANRDSNDTLDIEQDCLNANNTLLAKYSYNLASLFEKESSKWK
jgi:hypothetical protein